MGKSRKMAKTSIPKKSAKSSQERTSIMTQKLDSSKEVAKSKKKTTADLFNKSVGKYKEDLAKLQNILQLEKEKNMDDDTQDLKIVALEKLENMENEEQIKNKYKKPSTKQRKARQFREATLEASNEYKTTEQKMIESLKNTIENTKGLSRGQRKRMKKKERILKRTLLEEKIKMDQQLVGKGRKR